MGGKGGKMEWEVERSGRKGREVKERRWDEERREREGGRQERKGNREDTLTFFVVWLDLKLVRTPL